jgi:hypothetical protein
MKLGQYHPTNGAAKAANGNPSHGERGNAGEPEVRDAHEMEKLRELLIGTAIGDIREELGGLARQVSDGPPGQVREIMDRRLASFEKVMQTKLDQLAARIDTEASQRMAAHQRQQEQFEEQQHALEVALDTIGSRIDEGSANLSGQLHGQSRLFSDSIRRTASKLSEHFDKEFEMLSWARADRNALARVVHELAIQLQTEKP